MFRGCAPRTSLVQRALRPSIQNTLPRVRNATTLFSSSALRAQQYPPEQPEEQPTAARIPLSIQAIYYKPLHRTPLYGLPVCNLDLRSYSLRQLEAQCDFALRAAYYLNMPASGTVPLPRRIERWTVPRSNFVHKKSQENYERITYKRLIQIKDANPEVIELWLAFIKKHAIYGVGMKANVWAFEEVGVGKQMNVSLANLHDVKRPRWAHFGPRKTVETAAMVRDILESEKYKVPEFKATEAARPDAIDQQPVVLPQEGRRPKGIKKIEEDITSEELRFRELEMEVAQTHTKDYLRQATDGQRVAEEKLAETREALKSEPQKPAAQKPELGVTEPEPTPAKAEQQRSAVDIIRDLELKKALEAKEAAEARAAEESRKTAELQAQLLAQVAAIQAELAALRAEKASSAAPAPAPPTPAETKVEVEAAPSTLVEKQAEAVAAEEVAVPEPTATETPITESIPAHTTNEPAEELTAAPESPVINVAAAESATEQLTHQAEADTTEAAPAQAAPINAAPAQTTPEPIPAHPADQPAGALTATLESPANDSGVTEAALVPEAAEPVAESEPASTEAAPEPVEMVAEKAVEDTLPAAAAEEFEPVPYEATEVIAESAGTVESPEPIVEAVGTVESPEEPIKAEELLKAGEAAPIEEPATPEEPATASESQAEPESVAEAQPKRQEEQPEVQIVNEEPVVDELPASSETTETPDVVKRQPEVTRDEEPVPERHEKPEEIKDEEQPR